MRPLQETRIITVTLNPAIDKTVEIDDLKVGEVNRLSSVRLDAGGKGINVSKVIKSLGGESKSLGILAGRNGEFIKSYLDSEGINSNFVFVNGETRTNMKVIDRVKKENTDINEPGNAVSSQDLSKVEETISKEISNNSIVVFSGSIPAGIPRNIYATWIRMAKEIGASTILDADGELLREGIKAGPYMVKPNIHELEMLYNEKLNSIKDVVTAAQRFFEYGVEKIVVSLGGDGGLFIDKDNIVHVQGLKVPVKSTVGAGDSMVAALAIALERGYTLEETVILATATSAANVMTSGTQPAELKDILELEKQVKFEYIKL